MRESAKFKSLRKIFTGLNTQLLLFLAVVGENECGIDNKLIRVNIL
jgi:ATP-dependent helicase/DNAse subunit B